MENSSPPKKVYRVQGIPLGWDAERLQTFLKEHHQSSILDVASLSREINGNSSSATVDFDVVSPACEIRVPRSPGQTSVRQSVLTIDEDFLGVTTLYSPEDEDYKIDIVVVPGLGGHAFGSFKERGNAHMWLRDALPFDITIKDTNRPMARVMIYGYESRVPSSNSFQDLGDLATSLRSSLMQLATKFSTRPIIFISHSMGGLIVKEMLIAALRSSNEADQVIAKATCGVVFFGVPHGGMNINSIIQMAGDGPNRCLVDSLNKTDNDHLPKQQDEFRDVLKHRDYIEIACFYETVKSPTAQQDEKGVWSMSGPREILVGKDSAIIRDSGKEIECAINLEHSEMVKFKPNDSEYKKALGIILRIVHKALAKPRQGRQVSADDFSCWHEKDLDQDYPGMRFWYRETIGQNGYPANVDVRPQFLNQQARPIGQRIITLRRVCNLQIRGHVRELDPGPYRLVWIFWFFAGNNCPSSSQQVPTCWHPNENPANTVCERSFALDEGSNSTITPDSGWFYPWGMRCSAGRANDSVDFLHEDIDVNTNPSIVSGLLASGFKDCIIEPGLWNTKRNTGWCEIPGPSIEIGNNGELFLVISRDFERKWVGGFSFGGVRIEPIN